MGQNITKSDIEQAVQYLKDHPIDPAYDEECEYYDSTAPEEQQTARIAKSLLDRIGVEY